jgi:BirA family biotin operon repressor/biotin-[acetyl-CoA-carboxylase] ligase
MAPTPLTRREPGATSVRPPVLDLLADGRWHSGVSLGAALGLSRAAIWKQVRGLRALGLTVCAERGRGYRLRQPLDLLDASSIRAGLAPATRQSLDALSVLAITASTNKVLAEQPPPVVGRLLAVVAEYQTGGRGRRGRRWLSPLGHGICLSVAWAFEFAPRELPSLSLVAGVAIANSLARHGVGGVQLKWPNDVMAVGGKVGGILVEVSGEPGGPLRAVIGIGLNVRPMPGIMADLREEGGNAPAASLDDLEPGSRLDRNSLVASLLDALYASLCDFAAGDSAAYLEAWRQHDYLAGKPVVVTLGDTVLHGFARGIAQDGALLLEAGGRLMPIVAGDVTLRVPATGQGAGDQP